jgi:hypothetical protein
MPSSGMLCRVSFVRSDVSGESIASVLRVTRIGGLGATLGTESLYAAVSSCETSVLTRATRRNIPENCILYSHRRENLKSYRASTY